MTDEPQVYRYRNASSRTLSIFRLGVVVEPGGEFSSPFPIDDGNYELVTPKKRAGMPGKEED